MHLQVVRARLGEDDPRIAAIRQRERQLLRQHALDWLGPLIDAIISWGFERGLVQVEARAEKFLTREMASLALTETCCWIDSLRLHEVKSQHIVTLAASPWLGQLTTLDLSGLGLRLTALRALTNSHYLARLHTLRLADNRLGAAGAALLANCPHLAQLTTLDLSGNRIGDAGAAQLAESPHLGRLTTLLVARNKIGMDGFALLRARFGDGAQFLGLKEE
jgi:hypothetical protein